MTDKKVSALTDGTTANDTDRIPVARSPFGSGDNAYITPAYLDTYMASTTKTLINKTLTAPTLTGGVTFTGGTVTSSTPVVDATQTWNSGAVTFTGLKLNVTDTASASASLLMDLQVGGSSVSSIDKSGNARVKAIYSYTGGTNNGFFFGANAGTQIVVYTNNGTTTNAFSTAGFKSNSTGYIGWTSTGDPSLTPDTYLTRAAAATLQLGAADAASPVAQTVGVQNVVAGTSNTAGANFTIRGSAGTGTGAGGSLIFQVAPAGSTGTAQNAFATALTINSSKQLIFEGSANAGLFKQSATDYIEAITGYSMVAGSSNGCSMSTGGFNAGYNAYYGFNGSNGVATRDTFISRAGAANVQFGAADAASPVAQTISFQSVVAGTSNTAGVNTTIKASAGTGTGAGGSLIFQVAPAGSTGTAQNAFATALTINSAQQIIAASNGTVSAPAFVFGGRGTGTNWGFFSGGASSFSNTIGGTETQIFWSDGSLYLKGTNPELRIGTNTGWLSWGTSADVALYRDAANTLALRNSTNAQTFNIYNTYTDGSNYARWGIVAGSVDLTISNAAAGTGGTSGSLILGTNAGGSVYIKTNASNRWLWDSNGHFLANVDNSYDIGASGGTSPRNIYASSAATIYRGTAIPAGGTAGAGYKFSSTSNFGVFFGSGAPTLSAAKGSLYLRSDGSTTNDRMYVNSDGSTTWVAVTTAA